MQVQRFCALLHLNMSPKIGCSYMAQLGERTNIVYCTSTCASIIQSLQGLSLNFSKSKDLVHGGAACDPLVEERIRCTAQVTDQLVHGGRTSRHQISIEAKETCGMCHKAIEVLRYKYSLYSPLCLSEQTAIPSSKRFCIYPIPSASTVI